MRGISIYLSDSISRHEGYIAKMKSAGFTSIFTSLQIPEENPDLFVKRLKELGKLAKKYGMELTVDISPKSLQRLGCTWESIDQLTSWGLTGLRIDYGISEEIMVELSRKMKIALNASTLTKEGMKRLKSLGLCMENIEAWHNYYPRPETGLDRNDFSQQNDWLQKEGILVAAFIPGDEEKRGPLYSGLPTLEDHRRSSPFLAYLDLKINESVDKILIGDVRISEKALEQFSAFNQNIILLRAKPFVKNDILQKDMTVVQTNRVDAARDVIRSQESRENGLVGKPLLEPIHTIARKKGSITVDNLLYGRYRGEIQIVKRDLPADEKVNVIGKVIDEDLSLLPFIKGGTKFKIKWMDIE
ncbi:MupG family TIM beta-alpha barrel fold protein [Bacillus sp. FSL W8-0102]|uniref:DUF871 domain-containing protein n=1 Tax=Bacillus sp. FSL W8-0102 TaxID=2978205 RepID=UPI0030FA56C5